MSRWWQNMWMKLLSTVWITYTAQLTFYTWLPTFIVRLHVSNQHNSTKNMLPIFFGSFLWSSINIVQWHYIRRRNICDEKKKLLFRRMHVNTLRYLMKTYVSLICFLTKFGKLSWFYALFTNILHYLMRLI